MTTTTEQFEKVDSIRGLARLLERAHSTVAEWVNDDRWPFGPAPWFVGLTAEMLTWAEELEDGRYDARYRTREEFVAAPGPFAFTWQNVIDPKHIGGKGRVWMGDALFAHLTQRDFEELAKYLNLGTQAHMVDVAGEHDGRGVMEQERPAYFRRLFSYGDEEENALSLLDYWSWCFNLWLERTFEGRVKGWKKLLPPDDSKPAKRKTRN